MILKKMTQNASIIINAIQNYEETALIGTPSPEGYKVAAIQLILEGLQKKPSALNLFWAIGLKQDRKNTFADVCKRLSKMDPSFPSQKELTAFLALAKPEDHNTISDILLCRTAQEGSYQLSEWDAIQTTQKMKQKKYKGD